MGDTYVFWGDGTLGRLINTLPEYKNAEDYREYIPFIMEFDKQTQQWLQIELNLEGVNEYGKPEGMLIKLDVLREKLVGPNFMKNGDQLFIVLTTPFGQDTALTRYFSGLQKNNDQLSQMVNMYKAQTRSLLEELKQTSLNVQDLIKAKHDIYEAATDMSEKSDKDDDESGRADRG